MKVRDSTAALEASVSGAPYTPNNFEELRELLCMSCVITPTIREIQAGFSKLLINLTIAATPVLVDQAVSDLLLHETVAPQGVGVREGTAFV